RGLPTATPPAERSWTRRRSTSTTCSTSRRCWSRRKRSPSSKRGWSREEPVRSHPPAAPPREEHQPEGRATHALLRAPPAGHQARDQEGRRVLLQREGRRRARAERAREGEAPGPLLRAASGLEEGLRRARQGREDDRVLRPGIVMALKKYNPTSPGRRFMTALTFDEITRSTPEKGLTEAKKRTGGRNGMGRITSWFRGGGHKQRYRLRGLRRDQTGVPAKVAAIEYDPNRSARLALLHYADGDKRYILWPEGLVVGATVLAGGADDTLP